VEREQVQRVLDDPVARELLQSPLLTRLAYVASDGFPRVVPIGYVWNGTSFVVCTVPGAPKVRALRSNPRVALTVDTETMPPHVLLVRGAATVEVVDGVPDEFLEASRKGLPPEQWDGFEAQNRALYKQMARITIEPLWAKVLDFETRLPSAVQELIAAAS
jgi:hypothetical protein